MKQFGTLGIALLAAIILVYLVMVSLYDSFVHPFVVLFAIPLSFIGALALALTNNVEYFYYSWVIHVNWSGL
jgi:HAE1 family hydrophobic/amphiphilic exporter-1